MDQSAEMNTIELNEDNVSGTTTDVNNTETSDQEIESLLHDLNTTPENDAAVAALEKLRVSTKELTSTLTNVTRNIDSKYDVSTNAKQIDSKLGVSSTVKSTSKAISSLWSSVQSSSTTQTVKKSVTETVGKSVEVINEKTGLSDVLNKEKERVKKLDRDHGLTQGTLEKLAVGVNWVNESLKQTSVAKPTEDEQDYDNLLAMTTDEGGAQTNVLADDQVGGNKM